MKTPKILIDHGPWKGAKPRGANPSGIVVHGMGQYIGNEYASEWLKKHYSAHAFIDPNGTIIKAIPEDHTAWHAGVSDFNGLKNLNKHFLGVELLVKGHFHNVYDLYEAMKKPDCYSNAQYESLAYLCNEWIQLNPSIINECRIVGHDAVAGDNVRGKGEGKQDPGVGFDWGKLWKLMNNVKTGC